MIVSILDWYTEKVEKQNSSNRALLEKLKMESEELRFDEAELNGRLIELDNGFEYDDAIERPEIEITDDTMIIVNGVQIALSPTRCFVLNALRLSQGFPLTAQEMVEAGYQGSKKTLYDGLTQLLAAFRTATEQPVVDVDRTASGRSKSLYTLRPEVKITDTRREGELSLRERLMREGLPFDASGEPLLEKNGSIAFVQPKQRAFTTQEMIKKYRGKSKVDSQLARLFANGMGRRSERYAVLPIPYLPRLSPEEEAVLLAQKERALLLFISGEEETEHDNEDRIIEGVQAFFELFARNLDLVNLNALHIAKSFAGMYHDAYQEGAVVVFREALRTRFDCTGEAVDFRLRASMSLQGLRRKIKESATFAPVSYGTVTGCEVSELIELIDNLYAQNNSMPDADLLSQCSGISKDRVVALLNLVKRPLEIDTPDGWERLTLSNQEEDFVDDAFRAMEREEAMDTLFFSATLDDNEKIVLSLLHEVYHASLRNAGLKVRNAIRFTYPDSEEEFLEFVGKGTNFTTLAEKLGTNKQFVASTCKQALVKARRVLADSPVFDLYDWRTEDYEREEAAREDIIALALEISPDKGLTETMINDLYKQKIFPWSLGETRRLFGSIGELQIACGFSPDARSELAGITAEEVVALAKKLGRSEPFTRDEIDILSRQKKFVSSRIIYSRFDSLDAFNRACGLIGD